MLHFAISNKGPHNTTLPLTKPLPHGSWVNTYVSPFPLRLHLIISRRWIRIEANEATLGKLYEVAAEAKEDYAKCQAEVSGR